MPDITPKTELTVEQIVNDWFEYYLSNGQNMDNIHALPFEQFGTQSAFTTVPTEDTILRESNVEMQEIVQQYQDDFTPKGGVAFTPREIPLYKMKIDQEFNPHKLQRSWLGFLASNNTDVTTWPFIRWFIEKYLMGQAMEDIEMKAIYGGVYQAPEEGIAGEAAKTMNGIKYWIDKLVAAGETVPIVTGAPAVDPVDFVDQVEEFVQAIPEKYRYMNMELNMNRTLRDRFTRGQRTKYRMNYAPGDVSASRVTDFENIQVIGRASMMGSNRIWLSVPYNAILGVKGFSNVNAFEVEKSKRKVATYTEWYMGAGFITGKMVYTNDQ